MGTNAQPDAVARVLFGQTRRQVLALLLGRPDERFYLRQIVRAVGAGTGAVQRELGQLSEAGLLTRAVEGRQVYFSANQSATIFPELRAIIEKTSGAAEVLRVALSSLIGEDRIRLAFIYGSVAAGSQSTGSDVDLLVVGDVTLAELVPAVRAAETRLGREVNPSVYPANELRARIKKEAHFLKRVLAGPKLFVVGDEHELDRLAR